MAREPTRRRAPDPRARSPRPEGCRAEQDDPGADRPQPTSNSRPGRGGEALAPKDREALFARTAGRAERLRDELAELEKSAPEMPAAMGVSEGKWPMSRPRSAAAL